MLGPMDYVLWFASVLLHGGVVVCSLRSRSFLRYFPLNLYMMVAVLVTVGRFFFYHRFGLQSDAYSFFYFYSDALLVVFLYLAIMGLFSLMFEEMKESRYVRIASILLLGGTALFSYLVVVQSSHRMMTKFVIEMAQNMNFVAVVLTYVLWGALLKLRETRTRLIQLVLALGVYVSAFAAHFALHSMFAHMDWIWAYFPPVMALWLPTAWAYTFWKIPEEARLATARLAARPR